MYSPFIYHTEYTSLVYSIRFITHLSYPFQYTNHVTYTFYSIRVYYGSIIHSQMYINNVLIILNNNFFHSVPSMRLELIHYYYFIPVSKTGVSTKFHQEGLLCS